MHAREGARPACAGVEREGRCKTCGLHAQQGGQRRSCGALGLQVWRGECTVGKSVNRLPCYCNPDLSQSLPHERARRRRGAQVNPNIRKEKWTEVEDRALMRLVKTYGCAWAEISRLMDGRTDQQCMGRWRRHLDPAIRRDAWTAREDGTLQARFSHLSPDACFCQAPARRAAVPCARPPRPGAGLCSTRPAPAVGSAAGTLTSVACACAAASAQDAHAACAGPVYAVVPLASTWILPAECAALLHAHSMPRPKTWG